ncbi:uncharacterized protein LOC143462473 [Clavelina lepadiformis]|uniref:uncharacterized protein LOC143462473 n=1 Tax=Clavelina lepadiformis TaxID=159417 RepID=UPI004041E417
MFSTLNFWLSAIIFLEVNQPDSDCFTIANFYPKPRCLDGKGNFFCGLDKTVDAKLDPAALVAFIRACVGVSDQYRSQLNCFNDKDFVNAVSTLEISLGLENDVKRFEFYINEDNLFCYSYEIDFQERHEVSACVSSQYLANNLMNWLHSLEKLNEGRYNTNECKEKPTPTKPSIPDTENQKYKFPRFSISIEHIVVLAFYIPLIATAFLCFQKVFLLHFGPNLQEGGRKRNPVLQPTKYQLSTFKRLQRMKRFAANRCNRCYREFVFILQIIPVILSSISKEVVIIVFAIGKVFIGSGLLYEVANTAPLSSDEKTKELYLWKQIKKGATIKMLARFPRGKKKKKMKVKIFRKSEDSVKVDGSPQEDHSTRHNSNTTVGESSFEILTTEDFASSNLSQTTLSHCDVSSAASSRNLSLKRDNVKLDESPCIISCSSFGSSSYSMLQLSESNDDIAQDDIKISYDRLSLSSLEGNITSSNSASPELSLKYKSSGKCENRNGDPHFVHFSPPDLQEVGDVVEDSNVKILWRKSDHNMWSASYNSQTSDINRSANWFTDVERHLPVSKFSSSKTGNGTAIWPYQNNERMYNWPTSSQVVKETQFQQRSECSWVGKSMSEEKGSGNMWPVRGENLALLSSRKSLQTSASSFNFDDSRFNSVSVKTSPNIEVKYGTGPFANLASNLSSENVLCDFTHLLKNQDQTNKPKTTDSSENLSINISDGFTPSRTLKNLNLRLKPPEPVDGMSTHTVARSDEFNDDVKSKTNASKYPEMLEIHHDIWNLFQQQRDEIDKMRVKAQRDAVIIEEHKQVLQEVKRHHAEKSEEIQKQIVGRLQQRQDAEIARRDRMLERDVKRLLHLHRVRNDAVTREFKLRTHMQWKPFEIN